jgi:hypothetical protein
MDYTEAIKTLKDSGINNADEIIGAIGTRFKELSGAETKITQLSTMLDSTLDLLKVEGADYSAKFSAASAKIKSLQEERSSFEKALLDKDTQIQEFSLQAKVNYLATTLGANPKVLDRLIKTDGLKPEDIKVDGDQVKIKEEDFKSYSEKNWGEFQAVLFPSQKPETTLPTGSSKPGTSPENKAPEDIYLQKAYSGFAKLFNQGAS